MSEKIGKHKGSVETLLHEKKELSRLLQIVNSQLERHMKELENAGVDTDQFIQQLQEEGSNQKERQQRNRDQGGQKRGNKSRDNSRSGRNGNKQNRSRGNQAEGSDEEDADDLLEGENNIKDRDFSPR